MACLLHICPSLAGASSFSEGWSHLSSILVSLALHAGSASGGDGSPLPPSLAQASARWLGEGEEEPKEFLPSPFYCSLVACGLYFSFEKSGASALVCAMWAGTWGPDCWGVLGLDLHPPASVMVWFNPSRQPSPMQPPAHSPLVGWGRKLEEWVRKLMGWGKGGLISKAKAVDANKTKQGVHSLFPVGRQMFSHLRTAGLHHM